jgi:hypothetical protein
MNDLYAILKGKAYGAATVTSGHSNADAKRSGYKDVYDLIMSDSDHPRQPAFLALLSRDLPEGHRKVLLDGLAREYAAAGGWMAYVDRETN